MSLRCSISDRLEIAKTTSRRFTPEGFLVVPGVLARAGNVQDYTRRELGLDGNPDATVSLHRPREEVLAADALASFERQTFTLNHPPEGVTSRNWSDFAVGDVHDVKPVGDEMHGTIVVRDQTAIEAIVSGKSQLSNGYTFDLDLTPGIATDGKPFHGCMRKIRGNHTAAVDQARGGPGCRVGDETKEKTMAMRKLILDGFAIEVEDTQAAIVERVVADAGKATLAATTARDASEARAKTAETALATMTEELSKLKVANDAKVAELQKLILTPEQIEVIAAERSKVVGDAKRLAPEVKPEGKSVSQIRVAVLADILAKDSAYKGTVTAVLRGVEPAKASEEKVISAFDAVAASAPTTDGRSSADDGRQAQFLGALAPDGNSRQANDTSAPLTGRALYMYRVEHGGKSPGQAAS